MRSECYFCHIKTIEKLVDKFDPDPEVAVEFIFEVHNLLSDNKDATNPLLARKIHQLARKRLNHSDLYSEEKKNANYLLLRDYTHWKQLVNQSENPFQTAAKLAVIGNIIDYAAHSVEEDLEAQIKCLVKKELAIDESSHLKREIDKASSILYLGDNAGEIVFDRIFIETINHSGLVYAVRGFPVINDATEEDAEIVGISNICRVISNGYDAPSTLLKFCSQEFKTAFEKADLIISKGQGNYEGLMNVDHPNIFFLMMAKCKPMAEMTGVNKGDLLISRF